jgi:hypothetical protein
MSYTLRGTLSAADAEASGNYGASSALSADGTVMAVGASLRDTATDQGGVYIYDWSGTEWVQRGDVLLAADGAASELFGAAVALNSDGTILAVGAKQRTYASRYGGVYIYDWSGSAWVQRGSVLVPDFTGQYRPYFGSSVAVDSTGTILAVGAEQWDGAIENSGAVFIYDWSGSAWVQRGSIIDSSNAIRIGSGVSLSSDGEILAVGAYYYYSGWAAQGGVYIYDWSGTAWTQRGSVITASDAAANDWFGWSCALSGNGAALIVGATQQETTGTNRGAVYTFGWDGSSWTEQFIIEASDAADSDLFGCVSISSNGLVMVCGATAWEGSTTNQGVVYVYDGDVVAESVIISLDSPLGSVRLLAGRPVISAVTLLPSPLGNPAIAAFVATRASRLYSLTAYISGGEDSNNRLPFSAHKLRPKQALRRGVLLLCQRTIYTGFARCLLGQAKRIDPYLA